MKPKALHSSGMALIAVLWLVAAMSLALTSVVHTVRIQAQTAGLQRHIAVAGASADAAILLTLQQLHAQQIEPPKNNHIVQVSFEGLTHSVTVTPLNGLIDINAASAALLADLYHYAAGLTMQAAQSLAQATIESRQIKNTKNMAQGFEAVEDLLRIPTMTYDLYAKVVPLVTADIKNGSGRVNPLAAPDGVLFVLSSGNSDHSKQIATQRDTQPIIMDITFIKPDMIEMAASKSLKLQVSTGLPDGVMLRKEWLVYLGLESHTGLPWRVLSTHQIIEQP